MLKEVLEKQNNFESSLVDKLCSVESELQLIRDGLKPKAVTTAAPVKTDKDDETGSKSKNEVII